MKYLGAFCALTVMLSLTPAQAQETPAAEENGGISVEAILTIPSSYVFRGYVEVEDHCIFQPEITLSHDHSIGDLPVSFWFNAWASLTSAPAPGEPEWFNELDLSVGADVEIGNGFTLGLTYIYYNSPANAFDDIHEVGVTLSHDCWLNPSVGIYREICNEGADENTYIELGVTPGFDVEQMQGLRLDFPLIAGFSPDEYYTDDDGDGHWVGYASAGITATYQFNDNLAVIAGVDYIHLCADSTRESNEGDDSQIVGRVAFKFTM